MEKAKNNTNMMSKKYAERVGVLVNLIDGVLDLFLNKKIEVIIRSRECFKKRHSLFFRLRKFERYINNELYASRWKRKGGATYDMEKKRL